MLLSRYVSGESSIDSMRTHVPNPKVVCSRKLFVSVCSTNPSRTALGWARVSSILASLGALRGDHLGRMECTSFFSSAAMPTANGTVLIAAEMAAVSVFVRSASFSVLMRAHNSSLRLARKLAANLWGCRASARLDPKVSRSASAADSACASFAADVVAVEDSAKTNNSQCRTESRGSVGWLAASFEALPIFPI